MFSRLLAVRFDRRMANGKTKPALFGCEDAAGSVIDVVLKGSAGCERGVGAIAIESLVAMLAADVELPVPEFFAVEIEREMVNAIPDLEVRHLLARSSPIAFGSRHLPGRSTWIASQSIPTLLRQQALEILAFDAWLMNADRIASNPNCLSDGRSFAIFDHELCFMPTLFAPAPWVTGGLEFLRNPASTHLFYDQLRGTVVDLARLAGAMEAVDEDRLHAYVTALPAEWSAADEVVQRAVDHLRALRANIDGAVTEVTRALA